MQIALPLAKPIPESWSSSIKMQMPVKKRIKSFTHFKTSLRILLLFSHSVLSDSLWLRGLQHARLPSPSPSPRVCWNSCPLSQWCNPTISFSIVPFSSYLQSFPASGSLQRSQLFAWGGQSVGVSASASVIPVNIQDWCWSWSSNTLATWCKEQTHWKRSWFWERLRAGGEQVDRGWHGWMALVTQWTWVSANSGR